MSEEQKIKLATVRGILEALQYCVREESVANALERAAEYIDEVLEDQKEQPASF